MPPKVARAGARVNDRIARPDGGGEISLQPPTPLMPPPVSDVNGG